MRRSLMVGMERPRATLEQLRKHFWWVWVICERCQHGRAFALALHHQMGSAAIWGAVLVLMR
jgi:hypothetical protein